MCDWRGYRWQILSEGGSPNKVKWIKAEVSDMSELYKDKVLAEQIDQVMLKMEREVRRPPAAPAAALAGSPTLPYNAIVQNKSGRSPD